MKDIYIYTHTHQCGSTIKQCARPLLNSLWFWINFGNLIPWPWRHASFLLATHNISLKWLHISLNWLPNQLHYLKMMYCFVMYEKVVLTAQPFSSRLLNQHEKMLRVTKPPSFFCPRSHLLFAILVLLTSYI